MVQATGETKRRGHVGETDDVVLNEAQLDAQLAKLSGEATEAERHGGLRFGAALALLILALVGVWASLSLVNAEKMRLENPDAALVCDINPLIGCSKWIGTWQNEVVFGVSNSVLGLLAFGALAAFAFALVTGAKLARVVWQLLSVGMVLGLIWLAWFMYESYVVAGSLCPYCVVTWMVTVPIALIVLSHVAQAGHWGDGLVNLGQTLVRNKLVILVGFYVLWVAFTLFYFWEQWMAVFGIA